MKDPWRGDGWILRRGLARWWKLYLGCGRSRLHRETDREECPGVMGRGVGVVKGDAVEVDIIVAVGESSEIGAGLAEADAVAI